MDSIYPNALDGYSQLPLIVDGVTGIDASNINAMRSAIVAIEAELGIIPKGEYDDVASRLTAIESAGDLTDEIAALEASVATLETDITAIEADVAALEAAALTFTGASQNQLPRFADGTGKSFNNSGIEVSAGGDTTLPRDLAVTGLAEISGNLTVTGTTALNDSVTINLNNAAKELYVNGGTFRTGNKRYYGSRATPPTSPDPTPVNGDTYFDTAINEEMYWDNARSAWLSTQTHVISFGRNGTVPKGGFFRTADGKAMSSSIGEYALFDGMITYVLVTRDAPPSTPWEVYYTVLANGSTIVSELQLSGAVTSGSVGSSGQFSAGDSLSVRVNPLSPNESTSGTVGKVFYKWRK